MAKVASAPSGEIDLATVDAFRDCLYEIIDECDVSIVRVDLQAVTFLGSSGCRALMDANEYAIRHGHLISICNISALGAKVIGICDSDKQLHIEGLASATN